MANRWEQKQNCKPRFILVSYSYLLKNERVAASNVGWVLGHQWRDRHNTLGGFSADFCMAAAGCVAVFVEVGPICVNWKNKSCIINHPNFHFPVQIENIGKGYPSILVHSNYIRIIKNLCLVGGFNPSEKYSSKWESSPGVHQTKKAWASYNTAPHGSPKTQQSMPPSRSSWPPFGDTEKKKTCLALGILWKYVNGFFSFFNIIRQYIKYIDVSEGLWWILTIFSRYGLRAPTNSQALRIWFGHFVVVKICCSIETFDATPEKKKNLGSPLSKKSKGPLFVLISALHFYINFWIIQRRCVC